MKLIIIPGWLHTQREWQATIKLLTNMSQECIFINIDWYKKHQSFQKICQKITTEINSFKNENYILIGHSFGGRVVAEIITALQIKPLKIILIGSPNIPTKTLKKSALKLGTEIKNFLKIKRSFKFSDPDSLKSEEDSNQALYNEAIKIDQTEILPNIKIPTIILHGSKDQIVPIRTAVNVKNLIPNSELIELNNIGHNPHIENPLLLSGIINKLVNENI